MTTKNKWAIHSRCIFGLISIVAAGSVWFLILNGAFLTFSVNTAVVIAVIVSVAFGVLGLTRGLMSIILSAIGLLLSLFGAIAAIAVANAH